MKKFISILMLGTVILGACSSSGSQNSLTVGMECNYAPYNWTQSQKSDTAVEISGGQYCDGFDVAVAQLIAKEMGKDLVIQKTSWDGLIVSLQSKQIDVIIAGMSPTEERRKEVAFSNVYYRSKLGVIVKKDSIFASGKTVSDFADAKMTAQLGTFHVKLLDQLNGVKKLQPMKDFATMTVAAVSGEIDGFIADESTGAAIVKANPSLAFVMLDETAGFKVDLNESGVAVGLRKDDTELLDDINKVLSTWTSEQTDQLMQDAMKRQPQ